MFHLPGSVLLGNRSIINSSSSSFFTIRLLQPLFHYTWLSKYRLWQPQFQRNRYCAVGISKRRFTKMHAGQPRFHFWVGSRAAIYRCAPQKPLKFWNVQAEFQKITWTMRQNNVKSPQTHRENVWKTAFKMYKKRHVFTRIIYTCFHENISTFSPIFSPIWRCS